MAERTSNEELKRKLEREQDEALAKKYASDEKLSNTELRKKLETEQDKKFMIREIHNSSEWETKNKEEIKLPEVKELDDFKIGFDGKIAPCSGFIDFHGSKWAIDTEIYLTFSHWKVLARIVKDEWGKSFIKQDDKPTKITENYCLYCAKEVVSS